MNAHMCLYKSTHARMRTHMHICEDWELSTTKLNFIERINQTANRKRAS